MEEKRKVSVLAPYKIKDGVVSVFLQKRSATAERTPGMFGFFGGGLEKGETPDDALVREIEEELSIAPHGYRLFETYDLADIVLFLFVLKVSDDFEKNITISEGDYGEWFDEKKFLERRGEITGHLVILEELYKKLS